MTSASTPTEPEEAPLGTMAAGIKDPGLDKGVPTILQAT